MRCETAGWSEQDPDTQKGKDFVILGSCPVKLIDSMLLVRTPLASRVSDGMILAKGTHPRVAGTLEVNLPYRTARGVGLCQNTHPRGICLCPAQGPARKFLNGGRICSGFANCYPRKPAFPGCGGRLHSSGDKRGGSCTNLSSRRNRCHVDGARIRVCLVFRAPRG